MPDILTREAILTESVREQIDSLTRRIVRHEALTDWQNVRNLANTASQLAGDLNQLLVHIEKRTGMQ